MITAIITGAACGIVGAAVGFGMGRRGPSRQLSQQVQTQVALHGRVCELEALTGGMEARLKEASAIVPMAVEARRSIGTLEFETKSLKAQSKELESRLDSVASSAESGLSDAFMIIKDLEGRTDSSEGRLSALEETVPALITREEVQSAFAKAAQIEAQRQQAAMQQQAARQAAVFGAPAPPSDLNAAINNQLSALNERINRINQEFGIG